MEIKIVLPPDLELKSKETGIIPKGYYSSEQRRHHDTRIEYVLSHYEGSQNDGNLPDFTYYEQERKISNEIKLY